MANDSIRIRIAWGGPTARLWQGSITLDEGTFDELHPLGIQADEPGSMWLDGRAVTIRGRSPRLYDGLDVLVRAPVKHAKLRVQLRADDETTPVEVEIPLADTLANSVSTDLDQKGTRLLVRCTPGDSLRVQFDRRNLVFSPGEAFSLEVRPNLLPDGSGGRRRFKVQLLAARSDRVVWEQESTLQDVLPLHVPLQVEEGVYDLAISVVETPSLHWRSVGSVPLSLKPKVIAERKVQLLVLDRQPPERPAETESLRTVEEIDPANPKWWERFAKPPPRLAKLQLGNLSRFWQGPLGSGDMQSRKHPLGKLAQLAPSRPPDDISWEAYTLPIKRPGKPHVLEVEYPSDVPQQLGVSVLEPNSAEALMPIHLDSGVSLAEEIGTAGQPPRMLRHRLIFWPHTKAPLVLITNQSSSRPAVYGKIRVSDGWNHLPAKHLDDEKPRRLLGAYFDRPWFPESFCATEAYDVWSRRSLDDWVTFYQGGTRLVEYLKHVGMNGMMISAFSEGGTLYPSQLVEPTPRYDKGPFFTSGQDPVRKDVLEMLFRLFDRQQMQLIPAMEFAAPLPELEELLRAGGPEAEGIRWVGPEGLTWEQVYRPHQRKAPYYNLLHPRVQAAVLAVVREVVDEYASRHKSFGGVAIQLAGYGYGQLPPVEWGMDDVTIARFERETQIPVLAGTGPRRFAERAAFLMRERRRDWVSWRANCLARFYHRVQSEISAVRGDARVYLTTANLLAGPHWEQRLQPTLSRQVAPDDVLLEAGIDPARFRKPDGPVLIHTQRVTPLDSLDAQAVALALQPPADSPQGDRGQPCSGSLFFHQPRELRVESFDHKSPYRTSYTVLHSQLVPSSHQNRRRFVRQLAACDSQAIFDGGGLLPMGQQDALADLVAAYRRLPSIAMRRVAGPAAPRSMQPVTIRYGSHSGKTYVYAVNDSPAAVSLSLQVTAPANCRLESLVETKPVPDLVHRGGKTYWRVDLAPYDLVAARLTAPGVTFSSPEVSLPDAVRESLWAHIHDLGARKEDLRSPPSWYSLSNAGFEKPAGGNGTIPGWTVRKSEGASVELRQDPKRPEGPQVVRLTSSGLPVSLVSEPFPPPSTGRLSMFVWLRVPDEQKQPLVELVLEGRLHDQPFWYARILGQAVNGSPAKSIGEDWRPFKLPVDNLPLEGLSDLRVGVRLVGSGEVWIDDVELGHLEFDADELKLLSWMISSAQMKLQANQISDCIHVLEGYWLRFLKTNAPLRSSIARRTPPKAESSGKPKEKPAASTSLLDRMRGLMPRKFW